jgi:transcriptional regulator with GAF, ATPase, and Fis domain
MITGIRMIGSRDSTGAVAPSDESPRRAIDRVQFETLISDISARLIAVTSAQLAETIQWAMETVRLFFNADRCALLAVSDNFESVNIAYVSYADGVPHVSSELNLGILFPWVWERALRGQVSVIRTLAELPPEAAEDRANCEGMGTRSFICIPIRVVSARMHLIVIQAVFEEREWPQGYAPRLELLGQVLVNTSERTKASDLARKQAARIAAAVDAAELGFSEWSPETEHPFFDSRLCELLGIGVEEFAKARELWLSRMDPESRATVAENRQRILDGASERTTSEYWYDHPRRGRICLRHSSRRVECELGSGTRIVEAVEDITERRQALEDLQHLRERLESENVYLRQEAKKRLGPDSIIGRSAAIRRALASADQVATTNSTVFLLGETGCGKGRFASYIHECSQRRDRQMIAVNCSAIPPSLMESELFGREKGAYTGALSKQVGRFELAHGSTLFIDEIGELPLEMQVKLLRVLESRTIERLGNPNPISVDVRIIAATNRDIADAVRTGRFRKDLYYRLNVFPIFVPPLRERREDISLFTWAFIKEFAGSMAKPVEVVDPGSLEALSEYSWPGNVRELRNVVERAMIMTTGPNLRIAVPDIIDANATSRTDLAAMQREQIQKVLNETGWRIRGPRGAAARLGLKPTTLEARIKNLGLTRPGI